MRNAAPWLIALSCLLASACDRRHQVNTVPAEMLGHVHSVRTRDGRTTDAAPVHTSRGLYWLTRGEQPMTPDEVVAIVRPNPVRAVLYGMSVGFVAGLGVGVGSAYIIDGPCGAEECISASEIATVGGILGGLSGLGTGALIGLLIGSDDIYELHPKQRSGPSFSIVPSRDGTRASVRWRF